MAIETTGNNKLTLTDLKQDEDVLDTWASSWLWPFSVFTKEEQDYYYPTSDLVTAPDIIFFWVARMIIAGYEFKGGKPFNNVYFTGMVRDKLRRKMSKSLGNSPDPLDLIAQYGADGVRVGMLLCSPAGNDILFDESLTEQGRNFSNKIWNAFRLVKGWEVSNEVKQSEAAAAAINWFDNKLNRTLLTLEDHFSKFRISDALMLVYTMVRDDFSGWFLEAIKPEYQKPIDKTTYDTTISFFDKVLRILHPFMPFITEELYQNIEERESIMISEMPIAGNIDEKAIELFEEAKDIISSIRNIRQGKNIAMKEQLELQIVATIESYPMNYITVINKLANLKSVSFVDKADNGCATFMVKTTEYGIPMGDLIDVDAEIARLKEELKYNEGFLNAVMRKLENDKFVKGAPEAVVNKELQKKADAESKIKTIQESLAKLIG